MLSPADHARVAAAIADAERHTTGEILCTISYDRHRYGEWLLALAAGAAFILPAIAAFCGFGPSAWLDVWHRLSPGWRPATPADGQLIGLFLAAQIAVLVVATLLLWWSPLAQRRAPLSLRRARVHEAALHQFLVRGIHLTSGRTGVLIHASVHDHIVEVVADSKIHARVPANHWAETARAVTDGFRRGDPADGFVTAVGLAGRVLAEHFPAATDPAAAGRNELPNQLLVV